MFSSIRSRLLILASIPTLFTSIVIVAFIISEIGQLERNSVDSARETLVEAKKVQLQNTIDIALNTIKPLYDAGKPMSEAVKLLQRMDYGENDYIFGYTGDAKQVFSGSSEANIGKDYSSYQDANGVFLIRDLITAGKENRMGSGNEFVRYSFPKTEGGEPKPKLSYSVYLPRWDLMIGTGVYIDEIDDQMAIVGKRVSESKEATIVRIAITSIICFIGFVFAGLLLAKTITTPLKRINDAIGDLSNGDGDLTRRLPVDNIKELGDVSKNVNKLLSSLAELIAHVRTIALNINKESDSLEEDAKRIALLSESQAVETEQTAAAATELSQMASEVAQTSEAAAGEALSIDEQGKAANELINVSIESMEKLNKEVQEAHDTVTKVGSEVHNINGIIEVIESIAEQTNLLALNAAIEAARAGESGRGFAVVASEVRELASKTQSSTNEIRSMIETLQGGSDDAIEKMNSSSAKAEDTAVTITQTTDNLVSIVKSVSTLSDNNSQIAAANSEQHQAGEEISKRVEEISSKTHELHKISENNSSSVENLNTKADELESLVKRYKV